jgi:transcription antitermination factor NusG
MSREFGKSEGVNVTRRPRKWIAAWTFGLPDTQVKANLEKEVKPHFPDLLEVFVPMSSVSTLSPQGKITKHQPTTQGYIYLRVIEPSFELLDAVRRVRGIGGFVEKSDYDVVRGMAPWDIQKMFALDKRRVESEGTTLEVGDLIEVTTGALTRARGRIKEVREERVTVEISLMGRMVPIDFQKFEVILVEKAS